MTTSTAAVTASTLPPIAMFLYLFHEPDPCHVSIVLDEQEVYHVSVPNILCGEKMLPAKQVSGISFNQTITELFEYLQEVYTDVPAVSDEACFQWLSIIGSLFSIPVRPITLTKTTVYDKGSHLRYVITAPARKSDLRDGNRYATTDTSLALAATTVCSYHSA